MRVMGVMVTLIMAWACKAMAAEREVPCWRGPTGSGTASAGLKLLEDPARAKLLWISDEKLPNGYARRASHPGFRSAR